MPVSVYRIDGTMYLHAEADKQLPHGLNVLRPAVDAALTVGHVLRRRPVRPLARVHQYAYDANVTMTMSPHTMQTIANVRDEEGGIAKQPGCGERQAMTSSRTHPCTARLTGYGPYSCGSGSGELRSNSISPASLGEEMEAAVRAWTSGRVAVAAEHVEAVAAMVR